MNTPRLSFQIILRRFAVRRQSLGRLLPLVLMLAGGAIAATAQTGHFPTPTDRLATELMKTNDGLALARLLDLRSDSMSKGMRQLATAYRAGCQGNSKKSARLMKRALKKNAHFIDISTQEQLTFGLALQYHRSGQHKKAEKVLSKYLAQHDTFSMKAIFQRYRQLFSVYKRLRLNRPNREVATIPFRLDSVGEDGGRSVAVCIPSRVNGQNVDFTFDTGATLNVVSRQMAATLHLKPLGTSVSFDGMGENRGQMALAESVEMGDFMLRNVPFCIMDAPGADNQAVVGNDATVHLAAIVGQPVMEAMGCLQMDFRTNTITVTPDLAVQEANLSMGFSENGLLVQVLHQGHWLSLIPDMGATHSALSLQQLEAQRNYVASYLPERAVHFEGWGGATSGSERLFPQFDLAVGRSVVALPQMSVLDGISYDSRLGMDFFSRCERVTFRLRYPAGMSVIAR